MTAGVNMIKIVSVAAMVACACGCTSLEKINLNAAYSEYITQRRTIEPMEVFFDDTGGGKITFEGVKTFRISQPLAPLGLLEKGPDALAIGADVAGKVIAGGLAAYLGGKAIDGLSATPKTVAPEIVSPVVVPVGN